MKFLIGLLSVYFLLLSAMPCSMQFFSSEQSYCCADEHPKTEQSPSSSHDCKSCNPLSFCHCCGSFISFAPLVNIFGPAATSSHEIIYLKTFPSSDTHSIWQPPKIG